MHGCNGRSATAEKLHQRQTQALAAGSIHVVITDFDQLAILDLVQETMQHDDTAAERHEPRELVEHSTPVLLDVVVSHLQHQSGVLDIAKRPAKRSHHLNPFLAAILRVEHAGVDHAVEVHR